MYVSSPALVSKSTRQRPNNPAASAKSPHAIAAISAASSNESGNSVGREAYILINNLFSDNCFTPRYGKQKKNIENHVWFHSMGESETERRDNRTMLFTERQKLKYKHKNRISLVQFKRQTS